MLPIRFRWNRYQLITSILMMVGAVAVLSQSLNSDFVQAIDKWILLSVQTLFSVDSPEVTEWMSEAGRDITALGSFSVLTILSIAAMGFLMYSGQKRIALALLISSLFALLISTFLKAFIDRARPDLVEHAAQVFTASFPSGHSMHSAATYLTLAALFAQRQHKKSLRVYTITIALFLMFITGLSRLYLGVHWPSDVLAGWLLGSSIALLVILMSPLWTDPEDLKMAKKS